MAILPPMDEMLTMRPDRRARISGSTAWVAKYGAQKCVRIASS